MRRVNLIDIFLLRLVFFFCIVALVFSCIRSEQSEEESTDLNLNKLKITPRFSNFLEAVHVVKDSVAVSWQAAQDDGEELKYFISYKEQGASVFLPEILVSPNKLSHILTPLKANTMYMVRVRAKDDQGLYSNYVDIKVRTKAAVAPNTPNSFAVVSSTDTTASLSWDPAIDTDGEILSYYISYREVFGSFYGKEVEIKDLQHTLRALRPGVLYAVRLRVQDDDGLYSDYVRIVVTAKLQQRPSIPSSFSVTSLRSTKVYLSWLPSTDKDGEVISYHVSYREQTPVKERSYVLEEPTKQLKDTLSGLKPGTRYEIRVRARDNQGSHSDYADLVIVTPPLSKLPSPSNLKISSISQIQASLSWETPAFASKKKEGISYLLSYRPKDATSYTIVETDKLAHTLMNLQPGTKYFLRLQAKSTEGAVSDYVSEVFITQIAPEPPKSFSISRNRNILKLSWQPSKDDGEIVAYYVSYKKKRATNYGEERVVLPLGTEKEMFTLDALDAHSVRIRARDDEDLYSDYAELLIPSKVPTPPTFFSIKSISQQKVQLLWNASQDDGIVVSYYVATKKKGATTFKTIKVTPPVGNVITHELEGWEVGSDYLVRITAQDEEDLYSEPTDISVTLSQHEGAVFGGTQDDVPTAIIVKEEGGYIIVGSSHTKSAGRSDMYVLAVDENYKKLWEKTFGGKDYDGATRIIKSGDGNYFIVGNTWSKGGGKSDGWLLKINKDGDLLWDKTFGGRYYENFKDIVKMSDDAYLIVGVREVQLWGREKTDLWMLKVDRYGNQLYSKGFWGRNIEEGRVLVKGADGSYLIAGTKRKLEASYWVESLHKLYMINIGEDLSTNWEKNFTGMGRSNVGFRSTPLNVVCAAVRSSRGYIAVSYLGNGSHYNERSISGDGKQVYWSNITPSSQGMAVSLVSRGDAGYVVVGYKSGDLWVASKDLGGNLLWEKTFGGSKHDQACQIITDQEGNYVVVGYTSSKGAGKKDVWLLRLDKDGNLLPTVLVK